MQQHLPMVDKGKLVTGVAPATPITTSPPDWVSMKNFSKCSIIIVGDNATAVTGSAVTVKQATLVNGANEKAVAFSSYWANADTAAADTLTKTTATSNTFTTVNTNAKNYLYVIEVDAADLDMDSNFDCIRCALGNAANTVASVLYYLHGPRYATPVATAAITD